MQNELTLHTLDNEPRVLDTDLAERLGYSDPRKIRQHQIEANRKELETYGTLLTHSVRTRGRPAKAYYLNEEQALLVCMFSKTENAQLVRKQVIATFMAYRRGKLAPVQQMPAIPTTFAEALRLAADEAEKRMELEIIIEEELNQITVDEFRALKHMYWEPGVSISLAKRTLKLMTKEGVKPTTQFRKLIKNGQIIDVELKVYPRQYLEQAFMTLPYSLPV